MHSIIKRGEYHLGASDLRVRDFLTRRSASVKATWSGFPGVALVHTQSSAVVHPSALDFIGGPLNAQSTKLFGHILADVARLPHKLAATTPPGAARRGARCPVPALNDEVLVLATRRIPRNPSHGVNGSTFTNRTKRFLRPRSSLLLCRYQCCCVGWHVYRIQLLSFPCSLRLL